MNKLNQKEQTIALKGARQALKNLFNDTSNTISEFAPLNQYPPKETFVTLKKGNELRGCIGTRTGKSLAETIITATKLSATEDSRFQPIQPEEVSHLTIEISVLNDPEPISFENFNAFLKSDDFQLGRDGLMIESESGRKALFLPQVGEEIPNKAQFYGYLCDKAGIGFNQCIDMTQMRLQKFTADVFSEKK